jgi:hypothetical protein
MTKYIVRDGFLVTIKVRANDGSLHDKTTIGGEPIELDDDVAAMHLHKLELADPKARAAALKAEKERQTAAMATSNPAALIQQLVAALAVAQQPAATPPAE